MVLQAKRQQETLTRRLQRIKTILCIVYSAFKRAGCIYMWKTRNNL